ncbi:hypothetical protein EDB19DRAFT_1832267 [Suillus lakei]|nr:hypothetical protein EDB19DRAFT_1832267 [Suillus lakei]
MALGVWPISFVRVFDEQHKRNCNGTTYFSSLVEAMVEEVLRNGEIAIATLRKPSILANDLAAQYPCTQLLVLPLDVTNEAQVKFVFVQAKGAFGHVGVVYNNAGQAFCQELEGIPIDPFWGAVKVSFEAVKFFGEVNPKGAGGMLVQILSMAGITGIPLVGFYNSTKAALNSLTSALPAWNIHASNIN